MIKKITRNLSIATFTLFALLMWTLTLYLQQHKLSGHSLFIQAARANNLTKINRNYEIYQYSKYCEKSTASDYKFVALQIDGLYHTGTNWLFKTLKDKLRIYQRPPWHKHHLISAQLVNEYMNTDNKQRNKYNTLSVILIKHPLTWFRSYCKTYYDLLPLNVSWFNEYCPSNIHLSQTHHMKYLMDDPKEAPIQNTTYSSLVHVYNDYYEHYINAQILDLYPFIIVKYEDLLLDPQGVIKDLSHCIGADIEDLKNIDIFSDAASPKGTGSNFEQAQKKYFSKDYMYSQYTTNDLIFVDKHINHYILKMFGYQIDVNYLAK